MVPAHRKANAFHTLFHGALEVSDDPAGHLAYLGLPAEARTLLGASAFHPDSQRFIQESWNRIGHRAAAPVKGKLMQVSRIGKEMARPSPTS